MTDHPDAETFVPHVGWLRHAAGDDVATYLRQGWFEYREQALLWLYLRPGDVVIDCGAHVGLFSLLAARIVGDEGRIAAIEPDPDTLPRLRENLAASGASRVEVVEAAAWSAAGEVTLHAAGAARSAYSSVVAPVERARDVRVRAVTIDDVVGQIGAPQVALLKLDVEGAEPEAWQGCARSAASGALPAVLVEFTEANQWALGRGTADLVAAWASAGYRLHRLDEAAMQLVPAVIEGPVEYENFLAARDAGPINDRLRAAPAAQRRIAGDVLARGAAAFALLKRALDAEHQVTLERERYDEMRRRAGHYARYIHAVSFSRPMRLARALRLAHLPDWIGQAEADMKHAGDPPAGPGPPRG